MINKAYLIGNLTKDPQVNKTQSGISVTKFTVAVTQKFKDKEETSFINCIAWQGLADVVGKYTAKGSKVALVGRIKTGSYDDKTTGKKVYTNDVVVEELELLGAKPQNESEPKQEPKNDQNVEYEFLDENGNPLPF